METDILNRGRIERRILDTSWMGASIAAIVAAIRGSLGAKNSTNGNIKLAASSVSDLRGEERKR